MSECNYMLRLAFRGTFWDIFFKLCFLLSLPSYRKIVIIRYYRCQGVNSRGYIWGIFHFSRSYISRCKTSSAISVWIKQSKLAKLKNLFCKWLVFLLWPLIVDIIAEFWNIWDCLFYVRNLLIICICRRGDAQLRKDIFISKYGD